MLIRLISTVNSLDRGGQVIFGSIIILAIQAILAMIIIIKIILIKKAPQTKFLEMPTIFFDMYIV